MTIKKHKKHDFKVILIINVFEFNNLNMSVYMSGGPSVVLQKILYILRQFLDN